MKNIIYIVHENRKYPVIISPGKDKEFNSVHIECKEANINQEILAEDLPGFLENMGSFIDVWRDIKKDLDKKEDILRVRITRDDRKTIEKLATEAGYKNVSSYARDRLLSI